MILEVITPDEVLYKGNVSQVILPGLDGSFGILNSHAPLISALAKGSVRVDQNVSENNDKKLYNGDKELVDISSSLTPQKVEFIKAGGSYAIVFGKKLQNFARKFHQKMH